MRKNNYISLNLHKSKKITTMFISPLHRSLIILGTLLTGIFYAFMQWFQAGEIIDVLFICMLIGATFVLVKGLKMIYDYNLRKDFEFYEFVMMKEDLKKFFISVFNSKKIILFGIFYGLIIGSSPFVFNVWDNNILLKFLLSVFLFIVNFSTGITFYALIKFFFYSVKIGKSIKVKLWQRENSSAAFLINIIRRISLFVSIYISICISSILFSVIPLVNLTIVYSIFAALIILASLIIPLFPVVRQTKIDKEKALSEINRQIEEKFPKIIKKPKSFENEESFKKIQTLIMLRGEINSMQIWPFRLKILTSVISIIFVSTIPVILQFMLSKSFG